MTTRSLPKGSPLIAHNQSSDFGRGWSRQRVRKIYSRDAIEIHKAPGCCYCNELKDFIYGARTFSF
jgi:hypothetical protein